MTSRGRWLTAGFAPLLLAAAGVGLWFWQRPAARVQPALSRVLLAKPCALAPGVYLLGKTTPAAIYAVDTSDGLLLIDSGLENDPAPVIEQLRTLGFDPARLRAILLTHVHADHSLGAQQLRDQTGARIYAGRGDCPPLREGTPREAFFSTFYMPNRPTHATTVDVELVGDEQLTFGDTHLRVLATPGHTPGSTCYLLERPGLRALFTGDVIQHLDADTPDALGTYVAYLPPLYRGNVDEYLATLRRLRALPVPDLVLPGHPQMDEVPQSPHLTPEHWTALLQSGISELERVQARYQTDGANFLDGIPKSPRPGLHYLGDFGHSAIYCLDTGKDLFLVDAPGGPELVDFLTRRFAKLGWEKRKPTAVLLTSAGEEATAGLAALVQQTGCQVVAPTGGVDEVRKRCPASTKVLTGEELEKSAWLDVKVIPLEGLGIAPAAYEIHWTNRKLLFSGRFLSKLSTPVIERLLGDLAKPGNSPLPYLRSLERLVPVRPDLWLPAVPLHGQDANLYDDDWNKVLDTNRKLLR